MIEFLFERQCTVKGVMGRCRERKRERERERERRRERERENSEF